MARETLMHFASQVKRHYVAARDNKIVNRLNKTKREEQVDHEAQRVEREKARAKARREVAVAEVRSSFSLHAVTLTCVSTRPTLAAQQEARGATHASS